MHRLKWLIGLGLIATLSSVTAQSAERELLKFHWGKPVEGLQAGIAIVNPQTTYRAGDRVTFQIRFRNEGKSEVRLGYHRPDAFLPKPDGEGRFNLTPVMLYSPPADPHETLAIPPRTERGNDDPAPDVLLVQPNTNENLKLVELRLKPGTYRFYSTAPVWAPTADEQRRLPATGEVQIKVE